MNEQEQLKFLVDIAMAASDWRLSEDQKDVDPIRLEVNQRIQVLMGVEPEIIDGREQSVVERGLAKAEAKKAKVIRVDHPNTVRVKFPDGSWHRVAIKDLHQEEFAKSPTGLHWVINDDRLDYYCEKYGVKT